MPRFKTLSVLAGIIAALALSATPAFAEFESTAKPAQSQGEVNVLKSGEFIDEGKLKIACEAKTIKAQYHIQAKGQIKEQQKETTKGPHLALQVKNWGTCKGAVEKTEIPVVEVKPCDLQLEQRQKTEAAGGVAEACLIKAPAKGPICELQIPVGMETAKESGQGINVGLKEVKLENSGANLKAGATINGGGQGQGAHKIFAVVLPGHPLCPIKTNENAELIGLEGELLGLNA